MPELLAVEQLRVRFRTAGPIRSRLSGIADPWIDAVLNVSFTLGARQTVALVGESGSGKTTLGRAIVGLVRAASGSIKYRGQELLGLSSRQFRPLRRDIAMMFQDPIASLSPRMTVRNLLVEPLRIHRAVTGDLDGEAARLLDLVGLSRGFLGSYPHQLSGGQARRVGVARSLALWPKVIIADEPTAGLDVSVQGEVLNLLNRLQAELGLSYLIITHNLPVVRHVSDRVAIMYLGRFVEVGATADVFRRPAHPYTLGLLAAVPAPDPLKRRARLELKGEVPSLRQRPTGCEFRTRCPFARQRCVDEAPVYREIAPGHGVSCHFPFPDPADAVELDRLQT
jgi:oligopeptide/dipeptide ABC transporter ATP-binding protein